MSTTEINRLREFTSSGINGSNGSHGAASPMASEPLDLSAIDLPELDPGSGKETVFLPGGEVQIIDTARKVFSRLAPDHKLFIRGGVVMEVRGNAQGKPEFHQLNASAARTRFEERCKFVEWQGGGSTKRVIAPRTMSKDIADALLQSREAVELLPPIHGIINCPIIREEGGTTRVIGRGYDKVTGVMITGGETPTAVPFSEAVQALKDLLADFQFQTPGDESRAMAMLLSPALKLGGFIPGNVPIDAAESNASQTGKGYRLKVKAAIYNEPLALVARREGGVGSMDESLSDHLVKGRPFPVLDNLRGPLDSQFLEAMMTAEQSFTVRIPYHGGIEIDPSRFFLSITSNGVETTRDLANRSCIVRIRKQPADYRFKEFPEGDLLAHVRARQSYYLGCVFSIIETWVGLGKLRLEYVDHDFREWARVLGWIVPNLFQMAPLLDGHREAQTRVGNPALVFLRNVAVAWQRQGNRQDSMIASDIADLCEEEGIEIPGGKVGQERDAAARQIGGLLKRAFGAHDSIKVEGFVVSRHPIDVPREDGKGSRRQNFYHIGVAPDPTNP